MTSYVPGQNEEELNSTLTVISESRDSENPVDAVLAAFWFLYNQESTKTEETLKDCLKRAYWEVIKPTRMSYADFESVLIERALDLMTSARFKADMADKGFDYGSGSGLAWSISYIVASYYVLLGSNVIKRYKRRRNDTPLRLILDDVAGPLIDMIRLVEEASVTYSPVWRLFLYFFPEDEMFDQVLDLLM